MAPPSTSTQAPAIQAPPLNQISQTSQGSNGRVFMLNVYQAQRSSDVVNGTFPISNPYASVLFNTGVTKSFISLDFPYIIDKPLDKLSKPFSVEVADRNSIIIDSVIRDCVITLNKVKFRIDLNPMQMGSFDIIVGMDGLTLNSVEVVCFEKNLRISLIYDRVLNVFGDTPTSKLDLMSCFKAQCYFCKKYVTFVALVVEKEHKERKISDILIVRNFHDVFPDDDSGLPLIRQVKFRIDFIPRAKPVAKVPYRLASSKMQEFLSQLQ
ncbi:uncharacterized protein LOC143600080 [Bidens hawaiensis]|uniref:uncharacterized protein LOC143600080 n=1 Tax=Bidens hawaiensis TaxID=980011 RepID=UPI00404A1F48